MVRNHRKNNSYYIQNYLSLKLTRSQRIWGMRAILNPKLSEWQLIIPFVKRNEPRHSNFGNYAKQYWILSEGHKAYLHWKVIYVR